MGHTIDLTTNRLSLASVRMGWYACRCGETGFMPGEVEQITPQVLSKIWEVEGCPACQTEHRSVVLQ